MPMIGTNGIQLSYQRAGSGDPVLFIMGSGASGRMWTMHQTPALVRLGYECITFDNRGIAPSDTPPGRYRLDDLLADTKGLIDGLGLGRCHLVGMSLGALVAQELALHHPETVRSAVLIATRGRADVMRAALRRAERALAESDVRLPPEYEAVVDVCQMLSPATLNDDDAMSTWLDVFELAGDREKRAAGQAWVDLESDRRALLRTVTVPCRVIAFTDDLMTPPHLGAEVAEAIPDCDYAEVAGAGHLGILERPAEVNELISAFLEKH
ncbi:alpha/beta fold hydrolase [Actinacidiphila acididurans]|uniref:Alpha/beta hydrolase n=1 Tax=Actinacidiphila acididurans TaxID=2784346 RepID=A0ABS2U548_9ACTN|nr:alpha/beta hydrolase [Actinacidiphila acididurans]MBM9510735.1 alpha/beta hydrolase [Actinacidiphila acididurans]